MRNAGAAVLIYAQTSLYVHVDFTELVRNVATFGGCKKRFVRDSVWLNRAGGETACRVMMVGAVQRSRRLGICLWGDEVPE
jgi:hypothetical protein